MAVYDGFETSVCDIDEEPFIADASGVLVNATVACVPATLDEVADILGIRPSTAMVDLLEYQFTGTQPEWCSFY